jgi:hypothetical protein
MAVLSLRDVRRMDPQLRIPGRKRAVAGAPAAMSVRRSGSAAVDPGSASG